MARPTRAQLEEDLSEMQDELEEIYDRIGEVLGIEEEEGESEGERPDMD